jgi:hypothetical protein
MSGAGPVDEWGTPVVELPVIGGTMAQAPGRASPADQPHIDLAVPAASTQTVVPHRHSNAVVASKQSEGRLPIGGS